MGHLPFPTYICKHSLKSSHSDSLFFNSKEKETSSLLQTKDRWSFTIKGLWPTFTTYCHWNLGCYSSPLSHPTPQKNSLKKTTKLGSLLWFQYKVSLKETTIWVGILIIPLKTLKLMFKSLTFQICRIVRFKILIKILATPRLRYRVKTSTVFTSVYNAICILYLWDITLFSHGVGILVILNTFSCMMLMSTGQLWSSYKVNLTSAVRHHLLVL